MHGYFRLPCIAEVSGCCATKIQSGKEFLAGNKSPVKARIEQYLLNMEHLSLNAYGYRDIKASIYFIYLIWDTLVAFQPIDTIQHPEVFPVVGYLYDLVLVKVVGA